MCVMYVYNVYMYNVCEDTRARLGKRSGPQSRRKCNSIRDIVVVSIIKYTYAIVIKLGAILGYSRFTYQATKL